MTKKTSSRSFGKTWVTSLEETSRSPVSLETFLAHTAGQLTCQPAPDSGLTCSLWDVGECWPFSTKAWLIQSPSCSLTYGMGPSQLPVSTLVHAPSGSLPQQMQSSLCPVGTVGLGKRSQQVTAHEALHNLAAASCPAATTQGSLNVQPPPTCASSLQKLVLSPPVHAPALNGFQQGVQATAVTGRRDEPGLFTQTKGQPPFANLLLKSSVFQTASIVFLGVPEA